ncbi:MAG: MazG family protein [Myxococcota bacterium]
MPGIDELLRIMARLRDPERGCPWDLDQDFASISPHTIEEAYEVDEAIARADLAALRDELGDLLFQVVFQARLAEEQGAFDFAQVVEAVCDKLVRRHPHIFGDAPTPESAASQVGNWEAIKAAERAAAAGGPEPPDPFVGIPRALPALTRSAKIAGRLARLAPPAPASALQSPAAIGAAARAVAAMADEAARFAGSIERSRRGPPSGDPAAGVPDSGGPGSGGSASREGASSGATSFEAGPAREDRLALVGRGIRAWVELARQLGVDPEQALRIQDDAAMAAARRDAHQAGKTPHR